LQQWFTFTDRDRRAIRTAFRSKHWIGAALQFGFVGMTGTTLRSLEYVPAPVLRHLGRQFKQPVPDIATLRTLYRRRRTRFEHQRWAIKQWGLRDFDSAAEQQIIDHLRARTNATLSRGRLELAAREWLYRAYVDIPRPRAITVLVRGVVQSVALQDHRDLRRFMTEFTLQGFIKELLSPRPGDAMTHLEWLRRPPRRRSMKTLLELFAKFQWLEERVGRGLPIPISKERQQVYARRLRLRRSAHISLEFLDGATGRAQRVPGRIRVTGRPEVEFASESCQRIKRRGYPTVPERMTHSLNTTLHRIKGIGFLSVFTRGYR
jgi:hypothetical protein